MGIVGAFDVHRRQITFDYLDSETGQVCRGRILACREVLRNWLNEVRWLGSEVRGGGMHRMAVRRGGVAAGWDRGPLG
jgi:hypothetical protein